MWCLPMYAGHVQSCHPHLISILQSYSSQVLQLIHRVPGQPHLSEHPAIMRPQWKTGKSQWKTTSGLSKYKDQWRDSVPQSSYFYNGDPHTWNDGLYIETRPYSPYQSITINIALNEQPLRIVSLLTQLSWHRDYHIYSLRQSDTYMRQ